MPQRKQSHRYLTALVSGLLVVTLSLPCLAGVTAHLDRSKSYAGDPVTLTIESDGQQTGEPDLSPLNKDFKVLGTSTSSQVSIINGRHSSKTSWSVQLEPRHLGKITIPAVTVGSDKTRALELEVTKLPAQVAEQQAKHLFIEVEADHDGSVYIQQQIPYTVRLYYDKQVLNGNLSEPQAENAVIEKLGEDKQYNVMRNGQRYNVLERQYAISPEKSGLLQIPPVSFKGQLATAQSQSKHRSQHDQFVERFFRNSPFRNPGKPVQILSDAISIEVQSRPATAGNTWLPAEQLILQDSWANSPPQWRAGEPVTRTVTLQAKGLTGAQLPALQLEEPGHTRLYPEPPVNESRTDGDKVYGISKQTFTYIPGKAGKLTIPAIELLWWNTQTNQQDTSNLPKWEVQVKPGIDGVKTNPETTANNYPSETETKSISRTENVSTFKHWTAIAGLLILLTVVAFITKHIRYKRRQATDTKTTAQSSRVPIKKLLAGLEAACSANDAIATANSLLELGRTRWPDDPPGSLGVLATRLGHSSEHIMALDRALYAAANTSAWNGASLWTAVKDAWQEGPNEKKPVEESLQPLYPYRL